ncbi:leucine-rich repeat receptor-like protein kinase [Populus alba x Populus x berolinensis]|uniref:Leucine-rich repeat receptor-like protein kinase n=1 Tax=Populus alba x Populus x berolinensis TaxID=444605 RepID=A0AAD6R4G7_9ROSI|nr:leucine-rich repeat receptor-like protein kinase [Populus alba x Populus x berolinensis]
MLRKVYGRGNSGNVSFPIVQLPLAVHGFTRSRKKSRKPGGSRSAASPLSFPVVVLLELVSGRKPLERGKYLVADVSSSLYRKKDLYNLHELLDPSIRLDTIPKGLDKMVDLAMKCVQEKGRDRPTMGEVVKEIEIIL